MWFRCGSNKKDITDGRVLFSDLQNENNCVTWKKRSDAALLLYCKVLKQSSMANKEAQKENKDGIPLWIKRTGAFIGLIATTGATLVGIHTVIRQFKSMMLAIESKPTCLRCDDALYR